jgi:riboflavin kinase, archaea type
MAEPPRKGRLKGEELAVLQFLGASGAERDPVVLTSGEVGMALGVSQQAADRYLLALEKRGLLQRTIAHRKQRLSLTPNGAEILRKEYHVYRRIFEGPARVRFRGTVASGLGEGRYYLSQPGYVLQFTERLGYPPYPGTLNLRLRPEDMTRIGSVKDWKGIRIDGFPAGGRTFGGATCYVARLAGRACHLIVPDRTHHKDVVEFIAQEFLREALHLTDGDLLDVEIEES